MGPPSGLAGVDAVDGVNSQEAPILLGLARSTDGARDPIANPEPEATDLAGRNVHVIGARQQAVTAHEPEAFIDNVEDAGRVGVAGALGLALEDPLDEIVLALGDVRVELEILANRPELLLG